MISTGTPMSIPIIDSIASRAAAADAWICDIWGVVHNGLAAFPLAVAACRRFREQGGTVLLLTNAPRPAPAVRQQLERLRVPPDAYDMILTSGDLTRSEIMARADAPIAHLGPDRDRGLFDSLQLNFSEIDRAEAIVCSGLHDDDNETAEDYRERLAGPARRGVTMICANPDITVARGDKVIECAGALARVYESLGGPVIYAGKPYAPVYHRAFDMIAGCRGQPVPTNRILAIGDGVRTDVAGAVGMQLPVVYVASPIHLDGPLDAQSLGRLFPAGVARPDAAMTALAW